MLLLNVVVYFVCALLRDIVCVVVVLRCMCLCVILFEKVFAGIVCDLLCDGVWIVICFVCRVCVFVVSCLVICLRIVVRWCMFRRCVL